MHRRFRRASEPIVVDFFKFPHHVFANAWGRDAFDFFVGNRHDAITCAVPTLCWFRSLVPFQHQAGDAELPRNSRRHPSCSRNARRLSRRHRS